MPTTTPTLSYRVEMSYRTMTRCSSVTLDVEASSTEEAFTKAHRRVMKRFRAIKIDGGRLIGQPVEPTNHKEPAR